MDQWVTDAVQQMGIWGVGLLMLLENVFPPLPSELIMPLGGYLSASGRLALWPAILAGTAGSLLGTTLWYMLGRRMSREGLRGWIERHGVWLAMEAADVDRAEAWFRDKGGFAVFVGRLVPVVRTLISVPAGFSRMPLPKFLAFSAAGTALWTTALALAGRWLGSQFHQIDRYVGYVAWGIIAASVVMYVYRVIQIRNAR